MNTLVHAQANMESVGLTNFEKEPEWTLQHDGTVKNYFTT